MPKKQPDDAEPASEIFADAVCDGGTTAATCELCGREYYDANGEHMEEGELESYQRKRAAQPDKYIPNDGSVSIGHIDGYQVVCRCPCNKLKRYENFIWHNRYLIATYLRNRLQDTVEAVNFDITMCSLPKELQPYDIEKPKRTFNLD